MRRRTIRASVLLAVAAIAAGAIWAGSAFAFEWMIEDESFTELKLKEEKTSLSGGPISISVPKSSITIKCGSVGGSGKALEGGGIEISASLTSCEVVGVSSCTVSQPLELKGKAKTIRAGDSYYHSLEPLKEGGTLAIVVLKGEKCALPLESSLKGTVAAQPSWGQDEKQEMIFSEAISNAANEALSEEEKAKLTLLYGESTAFLAGELGMKLSGANSGKDWREIEFTRLCEIAQTDQNTCPALHYYPEEQELKFEKETEVKFEYGGGTTTCSTSKLVGETRTDGAAPVEATFSTFEFGGPCSNGCAVTAVIVGSYVALITTIGDGDGSMDLVAPEFKIACATVTCVYALPSIQFYVYHGAPAKIYSPPESMAKQSGPAGCAATGTVRGTGQFDRFSYELDTPGSLYVTG